jgi:cytochrome c biogenesis protein
MVMKGSDAGRSEDGRGHRINNKEPGPFSLYSFLSSSKFALVVLLLIGCVSLIGMFVLQNAPPEEYVSRHGPFWGNLVVHTGLAYVYRVWWFLVLIFLASLNLVLCSLRRIRPSFKQAFSKPRAEDSEALDGAERVAIDMALPESCSMILDCLKKKGFSTAVLERGSERLVAAQKGGISRIGFLVTHLAVLLVLVSGAINGRYGYRQARPVSVGDSLEVSQIDPSIDFSVRVDDFWIETTEEGRVRDWKSSLTVIEGDREILKKVIEVNHPLTYKGVSFYQASYGEDPTRIREARLVLIENGEASSILDVPFRDVAEVPGTDLTVTVTDYVPDFVMDLSTGVVSSRSDEPRLPAVRLDVLRHGQVVDSGWLVMDMEVHTGHGELGRFVFADYFPAFYTGLDVVKNPGISLMFTGFGVATLGISLSFLTHYRKLWIKIVETRPSRCEMSVAGTSTKHRLALKEEVRELYGVARRAADRRK